MLDEAESVEDSRGPWVIYASFAKDVLTKTQFNKMSHLDKIKNCGLNLTINGKPCDSIPNTPVKSLSYGDIPHGHMMHGMTKDEMNYDYRSSYPDHMSGHSMQRVVL